MSDEPDPNATQPIDPEDLPTPADREQAAVEQAAEPAAQEQPRSQVVYVHAPTPPKVRHNRLFAALIELLGTAAYALAYLGVVALYVAITPHVRFEPSITGFLNSAAFWVPILFYAIAAVLLGLLLNRAAWWVHVVATLAVAVVVYWASVGTLTLTANVIAMTPDEAAAVFWATALNPIMVVAGVMAREVAMWFGLAISVRGRKVRAANAVAKAEYEREQAEKKAEYERAAATV